MGRILSPPGSGPELVAEADAQPARHRSAPQFPTRLNICHQLWHGHLVLTPVGQDRQGLKHWQSVARPIITLMTASYGHFGIVSFVPSWKTTMSGTNFVVYLPSSRFQTARCASTNWL